jgi:hypothetical protein
LSTNVNASQAGPRSRSRLLALITLLNLILLAGLLYKTFGPSLTSNGGVTVALINSTPGPMLELAFEYPGGKLAVPKLGVRDQIAYSVMNLADFDATLSFKDERGHPFKESVRVRPYGGMLVLLDVQLILETSVVKTSEGKEETVVKASPTQVLVTRSYQRPGWERK